MKIGIFDSGLGGLSIFNSILKRLPRYDYVYLADNARVPYGGRPEDVIYEYTKQAVDFLFKNNCQLIILACNTATTCALRKLQNEYLPINYPNRRILGVVIPVVEKVESDMAKIVGVIATKATVKSKSYPKEIKKISKITKVFQQSCPLLVPIIENGEIDWESTSLILKKYLKPLLTKNIDTLVLGCTHYGLIAKKIKNLIPKNIKTYSQGELTANSLKKYLLKHTEINNSLSKNSSRKFYATDVNNKFVKLTKKFLGKNFTSSDQIQLVHI